MILCGAESNSLGLVGEKSFIQAHVRRGEAKSDQFGDEKVRMRMIVLKAEL